MNKVAIVGIGHSKFGKRMDVNINELAWESVKKALLDAGMDQKDIEFYSVGNLGFWSEELLPAVTVGEYCGLSGGTLKTEAACASGSAAIKVAYDSVASGNTDIAMAMGVEKMYDSPNPTIIELIGRAGNYFWEFENFGLTFPGYYALYATRYMHEYGATEEDLCRASIKAHHYGALNPYAQFQKEITMDDCLKARYVAWPLKLFDASPITDGSASIILANAEIAKKFTDTPVYIDAQGTATGSANLSKRENFLELNASRQAANIAYKKAKIADPKNAFDLFEVHDCFSIAEILAYEDLKIAEKGKAIELLRDMQTYHDGKFPANLDGGLKAKGHPIGATGVSMAVEITKQLRNEAEKNRQATIKHGRALAHNVGGTGHYAYVTIYSRGD
ncbi:MAG: thiolase domain-containing protein [Thermoplasmata archaeon]